MTTLKLNTSDIMVKCFSNIFNYSRTIASIMQGGQPDKLCFSGILSFYELLYLDGPKHIMFNNDL